MYEMRSLTKKYAVKRSVKVTVLLMMVLTCIGPFVFAHRTARAASATDSSGLALTPFIIQKDLTKGTTDIETISLHNTSGQPLNVNAELSNFVAGEKDGQPVFTDSAVAQSSQSAPYALSNWMQIINPSPIVIAPGSTADVSVQIHVPTNAEDGGHYGAVLFSYVAPVTAGQSDGSQIVTKTATLFFISTGAANEQGNISQFTTSQKIQTNHTINFEGTFADDGNVHLVPKGIVDIYDVWGRLVDSEQMNRDAQIVLPESNRSFSSAWNDPWSFGPYHAVLTMYYGSNNLEATADTTFWVLPVAEIAIGLISLVVALTLLVWGIRKYNAWIIRTAGAGDSGRDDRDRDAA